MKTKRTGPLFDMRSGSKFYIKLRKKLERPETPV